MSPSRAQLEADQTVETLQSLRDEGKVRFIGMSGTLPNLPDHIAMGVFDVFQIPYSAVQREHEVLITAAAAAGAGALIRGGAARGAPAEDKTPEWVNGSHPARRQVQARIATVATRYRWSLPNPGLAAIWVTAKRAPVST